MVSLSARLPPDYSMRSGEQSRYTEHKPERQSCEPNTRWSSTEAHEAKILLPCPRARSPLLETSPGLFGRSASRLEIYDAYPFAPDAPCPARWFSRLTPGCDYVLEFDLEICGRTDEVQESNLMSKEATRGA